MEERSLTDGDELGDGELLAELVGAAGGARPLGVHLLPAHQRPDPAAHPRRVCPLLAEGRRLQRGMIDSSCSCREERQSSRRLLFAD